ncbi:oxidoreductase [Leeia oryzae]|uniref:oxidoreductase n=1 Tax=Leeia oryzae TaxID=356662 RepID=UPI00036901AA|nr:oxidoreductase [Leeia oryzae]
MTQDASQVVRVGLIGYGFASKTFHAPLITTTAGLQLVAVSSSDAGKVLADYPDMRVEASPDALIASPDIDLIIIPTPNNTHYPLAKAALLAGKHVVVDKPFTLNLTEADDLIATARSMGKILSVFHNRRWDGDFLTVQTVIKKGLLGRLTHFESHFDRYRPLVRDRWREQGGQGSGLWYDLGPHLLDQSIQLFGMPEAIYVDAMVARDNGRADDYCHAILRYADKRVTLHASALVGQLGPRFQLHGTQGSFQCFGLDPQEDDLKAGQTPANRCDWGRAAQPGLLTRYADGETAQESPCPLLNGNYPAYYQGMQAAIAMGGANPVTAESARQTMLLVELGLQSIRERREVQVTENT